ncbi:MAG: TonB-dependent receptor [Ignavibacteriaceae bacterium]|nr:TonB-dependent receptor [Ignavibacteriaceae bacterium]
MKNIKSLSILIFIPVSIFAQIKTSNDTVKTYNLDPVTVTATQTEIPRSLVSPSISVISSEEINANPDKSIFSLISQSVPGVFVTERDVLGYGVNSDAGQINIRGIGGSPNNEVLILIDGRPQYMGWYGHPAHDGYLSTNIERVEVIRGPASMLYGSNAMGGVINIITHSSQDNGLTGNLSVSYGSFNTEQYGAHLGYRQNNWDVIGSFTHEHTDGSRPWAEFDANSGYIKASCTLNSQYQLSIDGSITKFETYDPGYVFSPEINNWMHIRQGYTGLSLENDYGISKGGIRFSYNFGHNELSPYYGNYSWVSSDYLAVISLYQNFMLLKNNVISAGIDVEENGGNASNTMGDYGKHSIDDYAGYLSVQQNLTAGLLLNAGARFVHNNYFGDIVIPQAGVNYHITAETALRASIGKGYRAPQIFELFQLAPAVSALNPEELWNYEIGISQTFGRSAILDVAGFIIDEKNTIIHQWYSMHAFNSGGAHYAGAEFSAKWFITNDFGLNTNYSYTGNTEKITAVPGNKIYASAEYRREIITASLSIQYVNSIYGTNAAYTIVRLSDYSNVQARIAAQITSKLSLSVSARNLLNKSYQTLYGYPMPGRIVNINMNAQL